MTSISFENAMTISQKHNNYNKSVDELTYYGESDLSPAQSCTALAILFMRSVQKKEKPIATAFGANLIEYTHNGDTFFVSKKGDTEFAFEEIPKVVLAALKCKPNNCHGNCVNACINGLPTNAIIHTATINYLPDDQNNQNGILHSFVELGNIIFDLDLGLRATKESFYKFFDVKEISSVSAKDIAFDFQNKHLQELSKQKVSTEVYLMAREDCVKLASKGK